MSESCDYIIDVCPDHDAAAQQEGCAWCELEDLRDVLDHVMRVSRQANTITNRLKFIELRAKSALEGTEEWRDYDYPRNRQKQQENLRARLRATKELLDTIRVKSAELEAGSPMEGFEALPTQAQWDVAFSTALLCVENLFKELSE